MNNAKMVLDSLVPEQPITDVESLREREVALTKLINAVHGIRQTGEWSSLKELLFDNLKESLQKQMLSEAKKPNPDTNRLNRLSGELKWAERYSDLEKLEYEFRVELQNIRQMLYGQTQKES